MPYVALQSMLDQTAPHGWNFYDRMHYLPEVGDDFIDALLAGFERAPTPFAHVMTGVDGRRDRSRRRRRDRVRAPRGAGADLDHRQLGARSARAGDRLGPRRVGGDRAVRERPACTSTPSTPRRPVREAFADEVWDRLVAVKRSYDPGGAFAGSGIRA